MKVKKYRFREKTPKRTFQKTLQQYSSYRSHLEKDFNFRCGYCNGLAKYQKRSFHIDHFAPKKHFPEWEVNYQNLVYSCSYCNLSKSDKWISNNKTISIVNDEGFEDPCLDTYETHFERNRNGEINYKTKLGEYMYLELSLFLHIHKITWTIERIQKLISNSKVPEDKKNYLRKIYYELAEKIFEGV